MNIKKSNTLVILILFFAILSAPALDFTDQGEYMGSSDCIECHERFYDLWHNSHHGKAMEAFSVSLAKTLKPMTEPIQIGEEKYIVEFDAQGGILKSTSACGVEKVWRLRLSFGGRNVRYFLIPIDKGKLQVAPVAYYVHQGRWYDATESMIREFRADEPQDEALHWTDRLLTFNTTCQDCHVSQLNKNYNPEDDSYKTTWKEPGINCETCHGPAEAHIKAAKEAAKTGTELKDLKLIRFHKDLNSEQRDSTCGPCHAKGEMLSSQFTPGELYFDHYDLTSYEDRDFWPDGRDLGENYTQTGWMANQCAIAGKLECIHCHTSSGRFRFTDSPNQSCLPCHEERVKNIHQHSHHSLKTGVTCIDCHMPTTAQAFMSRSDHTFRPPSPAATLEFGSPNACNLCHHDKDAIKGDYKGHKKEDAEWADKHVKEWFGTNSGASILEQGRIITACRKSDWDKLPEILAYLENRNCDPAVAVAILRLLNNCPLPEKWFPMRKQLENKHEWVRATAAAELQNDESDQTTKALLKSTTDRFRTVRIRAASSLHSRNLSRYSEAERKSFDKAHAEYWKSLIIWPDRWSTHYNQGIYFDRLGDLSKAIAAYKKATELRSDVIQPLINASMAYARTGNTTNAYNMLQKALKIDPTCPIANYNIALIDSELGNIASAETHLRAALKAEPQMTQAAYNLGVLLCHTNREEGLKWLKNAAKTVPQNWNYTSATIFFLNQFKQSKSIEPFLKELINTDHASAETYFQLAAAYQQKLNISAAIETYRKAKLNKHLSTEAKHYAHQMEQTLQTR